MGVGVGVPGNGDADIKLMVSDPKDEHYVSVDNAADLNTKLAEIVKSVREKKPEDRKRKRRKKNNTFIIAFTPYS